MSSDPLLFWNQLAFQIQLRLLTSMKCQVSFKFSSCSRFIILILNLPNIHTMLVTGQALCRSALRISTQLAGTLSLSPLTREEPRAGRERCLWPHSWREAGPGGKPGVLGLGSCVFAPCTKPPLKQCHEVKSSSSEDSLNSFLSTTFSKVHFHQ